MSLPISITRAPAFLEVPYCAPGNQIRPFFLRHLRDENKQIVIFHPTNDRGRSKPARIRSASRVGENFIGRTGHVTELETSLHRRLPHLALVLYIQRA